MTALLLALALATGQPPPTKADKLCNAIGQTATVALQPRDRLHLEENCVCLLGECASKGGARARWLVKEAKEEARREEEERREKEIEKERACRPLLKAAADTAAADQSAQDSTQEAFEAWEQAWKQRCEQAGPVPCQGEEAAWRNAVARSNATSTAAREAEEKAREAGCR